jgi:hypothetical protein
MMMIAAIGVNIKANEINTVTAKETKIKYKTLQYNYNEVQSKCWSYGSAYQENRRQFYKNRFPDDVQYIHK